MMEIFTNPIRRRRLFRIIIRVANVIVVAMAFLFLAAFLSSMIMGGLHLNGMSREPTVWSGHAGNVHLSLMRGRHADETEV